MHTIPSFVNLLEESWGEYTERANSLAKFILWIIPITLVGIGGVVGIFVSVFSGIVMQEAATAVALIIGAAVLFLMWAIVAKWFDAALVLLVIKPDAGAHGLWQSTRPRLLAYIGLNILLALIVWGGLLFFIIPGILFSVLFIFARQYFLLGTGIMDSLKKSEELVHGRWWTIALNILGAYLCVILPIQIIAFLGQIVFNEQSVTYGIFALVINLLALFIGMPWLLIFTNRLRVHAEHARASAAHPDVVSAE